MKTEKYPIAYIATTQNVMALMPARKTHENTIDYTAGSS
jgi:hypothetical protein